MRRKGAALLFPYMTWVLIFAAVQAIYPIYQSWYEHHKTHIEVAK